MKRTLIGLFLAALAFTCQAQGLNKVIVEKYYVSDANDSIVSGGILPVGSVTWRIYVDMKPGYVFQTATGDKYHALTFSTTSSFYNNADGDNNPNGISTTTAKTGTVMLDSWLSAGAASKSYWGVLKSEDSLTGNFVNSSGALKNIDTTASSALTSKDGMFSKGTVPAFGSLGIPQATLDVLGDGSVVSNSFSIDNGAWYNLSGVAGPTTNNRVLIAQLTTNGTLSYSLNFQLGKDLGGGQSLTEKYAATNAQADEMTGAQYNLSGTLLPNASILKCAVTSPANENTYKTGDVVSIAANASEHNGSITKVEFFVNGAKVGESTAAPYAYDWTSVEGSAIVKAVATDFVGNMRGDSVGITVSANVPPTVSITAPTAETSVKAGKPVTITADAADTDGSITKVIFLVDGVGVDTVTTTPYTSTKYIGVAGEHSFTAKAIDNSGGTTTSEAVTLTIVVDGINNLLAGSAVKVYPVPATDAVTLEITLPKASKDNSYKIINMQGQVVTAEVLGTITDKYVGSVDISYLPKGLYTIELSIDGKTSSQRIVKY